MTRIQYDVSEVSTWDPEPVKPRKVALYPERGLAGFHDILLADQERLDHLTEHYAWTDKLIRERGLGLRWRGESQHGNWYLIPVRNRAGVLVQVIERHAPPLPLPEGVRKYHAQSGHGIHLYPWPEPGDIVICSGMFDQGNLALAGFNAVTSTGGCDARGWEDHWLPLFSGRRVAIVFDRGEEGAGADLAKRLRPFTHKVSVIHLPPSLPQHTDVTDLARERSHKWLRRYIRRNGNG